MMLLHRILPKQFLINSIIIFLFGILAIGCATGRTKQPLLRAYQGVPPAGYAYQSLGDVYGEFTTDVGLRPQYVDYVAREAMMSLAEEAEKKGANAVIQVRREQGEEQMGHMYRFRGEAVIFEELPPE